MTPGESPCVHTVDSRHCFDIIVVLLCFSLSSVVSAFLPRSIGPQYTIIQSCFSTTASMLPNVVLVLYLMTLSGRPRSDFGIAKPKAFLDWGSAALVFAAYLMFSPPLIVTFEQIFGETFYYPFAKPQSIREVPVFMLEMLVIGFAEEIIFRSYLQTRFRDVLNSPWQAVVVTSLFFGLNHLYQDMIGVICTTAFALMTGFVFEWRRQIIPLAIMHALVDFVLGVM